MTGWALWQVALVVSLVLASLFVGGLALTRRSIPTFGAGEDRDGAATASWLRFCRTGVPAAARARTELTALRITLAALGRDGRLSCGHPADALCACATPIVSGPAGPPSPPAGALQGPLARSAAGPETRPVHDHSAITDPWVCQACADEVAKYGWPEGEEPEPYDPGDEADEEYIDLPPVDQAAHLQPITWADDTGSFAAICEADRG